VSGHSKWHNIKIRKQKVDAQKGKIFSKITREIIVAARTGGGNIETNYALRKAVEKAKEVNMPLENIKKAIMRGTGELPGVNYEHSIYEGYGPAGVAIMLETLTDNKQRTVAEIRHIFAKHGSSLGDPGCVSWIFQKKGMIIVDKKDIDEDTILSLALEAGAEDVKTEENSYEITTSVQDFEKVKNFFLSKNVKISSAEITMIPSTTVKVEGEAAAKVLKLMEALEEHEDVQQVYANFDIPEKVMEEIAK
jgi:YebC/PmpR family DNA-binding regulatory protein